MAWAPVDLGPCDSSITLNMNSLCTREGLGFRVQGSGFRVQGSGFKSQGSGFRVQGPTP